MLTPGVLAVSLAATLAAGAPIAVLVDGDVGDAAAVKSAMEEALVRIDAQVASIAGGARLPHKLATVRVRRAYSLATSMAAASRPGVTEVRVLDAVDGKARALLAHEAAHQFLWSTCPASSSDALFHEAFAVWSSGEAPLWLDGEDYLSLPRARALRQERSTAAPRSAAAA